MHPALHAAGADVDPMYFTSRDLENVPDGERPRLPRKGEERDLSPKHLEPLLDIVVVEIDPLHGGMRLVAGHPAVDYLMRKA